MAADVFQLFRTSVLELHELVERLLNVVTQLPQQVHVRPLFQKHVQHLRKHFCQRE